jgi:hypothetical protein
MALDSFFHNKIESMKLEIIQGQAVLRRLEAQRNDYNSRGRLIDMRMSDSRLTCDSATVTRGAGSATTARVICGRGGKSHGNKKGPCEGAPRGQIW